MGKIGNLPPNTTPDELCEAFAAQGIDSMTDCYIPHGRRRFGFLRFTTTAEGRHALQTDVWIRGFQLELEAAMGSKRTPDEMYEVEKVNQKRPTWSKDSNNVPDDPNVSADAP